MNDTKKKDINDLLKEKEHGKRIPRQVPRKKINETFGYERRSRDDEELLKMIKQRKENNK